VRAEAGPETQPGSAQRGWRDLSLGEATPFARLAIECATRPLAALAASLPEIIHFEIRERRERAARTKSQCGRKESAS
jgi:hypothetical protein